eukprot:7419961-Pyramimonas_sp.AAC.1
MKLQSQMPDHAGAPMSLKAAEVGTIINFALSQLMKYGGANTFGALLLGAGKALQTLRGELRLHEDVPPPEAMGRIREALHLHITCSRGANIRFTPKHHLLCHMIHRISGHDNEHSGNVQPAPPFPIPHQRKNLNKKSSIVGGRRDCVALAKSCKSGCPTPRMPDAPSARARGE